MTDDKQLELFDESATYATKDTPVSCRSVSWGTLIGRTIIVLLVILGLILAIQGAEAEPVQAGKLLHCNTASEAVSWLKAREEGLDPYKVTNIKGDECASAVIAFQVVKPVGVVVGKKVYQVVEITVLAVHMGTWQALKEPRTQYTVRELQQKPGTDA